MITTNPDELFDAELLRRYESVSLLARRLARGRMRAERRSTSRGASVEFAEYRPFVSGDDWRYIDWHAFARWRQLVMKLFIEEEDLHVHLMLDCSASMEWGSPAKYDHARRVVAGLAYLALANLDRAAIVPLFPAGGRGIPPSRGRERFMQMLRFLAACPIAPGAQGLEEAASAWLATRPRRGLVVYAGDLFGTGEGDAAAALDRLRHARHEIALVHVLDDSELRPPEPGEYELEDCETGTVRRIVVDGAAARRFRERREGFLKTLEDYGKRHRVPLLQAGTHSDIGEILTATLKWR